MGRRSTAISDQCKLVSVSAALDPTMKIGRHLKLAISDTGTSVLPETTLSGIGFSELSM
jgi:hypothetical protein